MKAKLHPAHECMTAKRYCRDHRFCDVEAGTFTSNLDEIYPMCSQKEFFRSGKNADTKGFNDWLGKNFYQRSLVQKKKMLEEGTLPAHVAFQDDNAPRYDAARRFERTGGSQGGKDKDAGAE